MKVENKIIILSIVAGLCVWAIDAVLDVLFFYRRPLDLTALFFYPKTFLDMLIFNVSQQKLYLRSIIFAVFIIFGVSISKYYSKYLQEKALRLFEERGKDVTERSFNIMHIGEDADGDISHVSPAVERVIGFDPEEIIGKPFRSFLPKSEVPKVDLTFTRALKGEEVPECTTKIFRKDGTLASVKLSSFPITIEGNVVGFIGSIRDVTEIKRMEEEIQSLSKFPSEDPNPVLRLNQNGIIRYANKGGQVFLHDWGSEIGGRAPRFIQDLVAEVLENQSSKIIEVESSDQVYSFFVAPIIDANYVNLYGRNVTERKKMERQLKEYSEQLEEKVADRTRELKETQERLLKVERMAAIGETAAMVGHDLRNPLQALVNTLYLGDKMIESLPTPIRKDKKSLEKMFITIREQVEYMNKIVSDLQDYASPMKLKLAETNMKRLIDDTLSTIVIPENVKPFIKIDDDFPKLLIDLALMKRVFINLVMNALQAMPDGGKLTIEASQIGGTASISFQDTGVGIPKENFANLFQPLQTTKAKGMGFGLSVCKRLVEAHEGDITVDSEVGRGSTFIVKIPIKKRKDVR